jgi:hypothetical protein
MADEAPESTLPVMEAPVVPAGPGAVGPSAEPPQAAAAINKTMGKTRDRFIMPPPWSKRNTAASLPLK